MLVFDTSILIDISKNVENSIKQIRTLQQKHPQKGAISFITYYEFLVACEDTEFLENFNFLFPTKETAIILAGYQKKHKKSGKKISLQDLFIASQVKEHNMTLVTKDKDFEMIDDIKIIFITSPSQF